MILTFRNLSIIILTFLIGITLILIPQLNLQYYPHSTITSKFIVFSFLSIVIWCLFYVVHLLSHSRILIKYKSIDIVLFFLILFVAINRYLIQENYSFSITFFEIIGLSSIYIVVRGLPVNHCICLLLVIIVSGIAQAVYGNLQLLGYFKSNHSKFNLTGSFFNPGPYAGFLISIFPIAFGIYLFKKNILKIFISNNINSTIAKYFINYIPILGVVSVLLVLPISNSRASWMAILFSSLYLLEIKYRLIKKKFSPLGSVRKNIMIALLISFILASLFWVYNFKKMSSNGRLFIWEVSTGIIKDNPILGVGFDRFKAHYMEYQMKYFQENPFSSKTNIADNTIFAFNEYLQFFVENGIVGFMLMIFLIYFIFKQKTIKKYNTLSLTLKASILSIGIFAFFSYPSQILPIKLVFVFCLALLSNIDSRKHIISFTSKKNQVFKLKLALILPFMFFICTSFSYALSLEKSFTSIEDAKTLSKCRHYDLAIKELQNDYDLMKRNGDFLTSYGKILFLKEYNNDAIEVLNDAKTHLNSFSLQLTLGDCYKKTKKYKKAEIAYKNAMYMIPSKFYPNYMLLKLYDETGETEKGLDMAQTILTKKIKVPSQAIEEIREEALKLIKKNGYKS